MSISGNYRLNIIDSGLFNPVEYRCLIRSGTNFFCYFMKRVILILILVSGFFVHPLLSQVDSVNIGYSINGKHTGDIRLFESDDLLNITLKFDVSFMKTNKPDSDYMNAVLTYYTKETDTVKKELKLRARGKFRRTHCDFPPLSLNFKSDDTTGGEFRGVDKLKIVAYCKRGYQQYILKEYLTYRLYNILTDYSLKVRLLRIKYIDNSPNPGKPLNEFGFVIEPEYSLENRTSLNEITNIYLTQKNIEPEVMSRIALFNYMIGNNDWSVPIRHNIITLAQAGSPNPELAVAVPYDFDFSGVVHAIYATQPNSQGIKLPAEPRYLGICRPEQEIIKTINEFVEKKDELFREINDFPYLSKSSKREMTNYLNSFYSKIDKKNSLITEIMKGCLVF